MGATKQAPAASERERDVARKRDQRAAKKTVEVPGCKDRRRRNRLEKDDEAWLRYYFAHRFWYPFTEQQSAMIAAIQRKIRQPGDQSIAASRGEGKSTLAEHLALKYVLQGALGFVLLLHSTGGKAEDSLDEIKEAVETNEWLLADYPEVCVPVQALEQTPNRAHYQLVTGKRHDTGKPYAATSSRFSWCGQEIVFPNVPGSPSAKAIIATRGLDAEVRGVKKRGRRPDLILIDDPDTEQTVNSEDQAAKLEKRIDRGLAFAGGQQKPVARVMLTTIQRRNCPSAKYTDPQQKPSWQGKRFRFLVAPPARPDLWDEYVALRIQGQIAGDEHSRTAHQFYLDNRAAMDAGAAVANPHRFNPDTLPDGSQVEASALEHYFNEVARVGQEAVDTELNNNPPEESGPQESGLTAWRVQHQVSGFARKIVPPGCTLVTQGIDCRKVALHWVVRAWKCDEQDGLITGYTIDYGIQDVWGTTVGSDEGVDDALIRALLARKAAMDDANYATADGQVHEIGLSLVDAGWRTEAIYDACRQLGLGWRPAMGFGKSNGCVQASFACPVKSSPDKRVGDRWFLSRRPKGTWLVCMDADFWKSWEHDRWLTSPEKSGAMVLFGCPGEGGRLSDDQKKHLAYSKHLVNETEVEELIKGVLKRHWKAKSDQTHYLDASYMSDVAASMKGVRLVKNPRPQVLQGGDWFKG